MNVPTAMDYTTWNDTEAVIYQSATYTDPFTFATTYHEFAVATAKKSSLTGQELYASGGTYTGQDRKWYLPAASFPQGFATKPGDVIVDAARRRWTVLGDSSQDVGATFRLTCRDLVLAWDLRDRIDVERAAISSDSAGAAVKTFPPAGGKVAYPSLTCRVQPEEETVADLQGIRGSATRYRVIVERQLAVIVAEDRLNWRGRYLDIEKYENARQLGELPFMTAVLKP